MAAIPRGRPFSYGRSVSITSASGTGTDSFKILDFHFLVTRVTTTVYAQNGKILHPIEENLATDPFTISFQTASNTYMSEAVELSAFERDWGSGYKSWALKVNSEIKLTLAHAPIATAQQTFPFKIYVNFSGYNFDDYDVPKLY